MEKDYLKYSVIELVNDDYFLDSVRTPSEKKTRYWDELAMKSADFRKELEAARLLALDLQRSTNPKRLSIATENEIWAKLELSTSRYNQKIRIRKITYAVLSIASALLIGVWSLSSLFIVEDKSIDYAGIIMKGEMEFNKMIIPKGEHASLTLSDSTKLWANAGTVVIYPVTFKESHREIYVEGEIFLDVSHNQNRPFIVKTKSMDVKVLGTQFNVSAYNEDKEQHIILVEGSVEVELKDQTKKILQPNQVLDLANGNATVSEFKDHDYLAWKDGYYQYSDQSLDMVFKNISKYYGNAITYDSLVGKMRCSGKLDLKADFKEVLNTLEFIAPIKIREIGDQVYIEVKP